MYSTIAYLYQQITRVLLINTSGAYQTMRYEPVYTKKLSISNGVDNVLLFEFVNQDQKPVNVTGSTFVFRLLDQSGSSLLLSKDMVVLSPTTGRVKVTLLASELATIIAQPASFSITKTSGGLTTAVFTDAQAGSRGDIDINNGAMPQFIPSAVITIPTTSTSAQPTYDNTSLTDYPDPQQANFSWRSFTTQEFYSSHFTPNSAYTNIQMEMIHYTGTVKVQGATDYQSRWYNVTDSVTYTDETGTVHIAVTGYHNLLRLAFNNSIFSTTNPPGRVATATATVVDGVVTGLSLTNSGFGYMGAPNVDIIGAGAGATAVATVSNGEIASLTLVSGGSGYRPNPLTNVAAVVSINTGFITDIIYR